MEHIAGQISSRFPEVRQYCDAVLARFHELERAQSSEQLPTLRLETAPLDVATTAVASITSLMELLQPVEDQAATDVEKA